LNSGAAIESASPEDAFAIYGLLAQAFGESYLKFTVYQSPRTAAFLAEQIAATQADGHPSFFVLRRDGELQGYYQAVDRGGEFFLNYIATHVAARRNGTGRLLLNHFEATGAAMGCISVGLEVFRSNAAATAWYKRQGYRTQSTRFLARFDLASFAAAEGPGLELDSAVLGLALKEEANRGFSRLHCTCSGEPVLLGFIDGVVCNIMEPLGMPALAVAPAVARRFGASRRWLLAVGLETLAGVSPPESQEEALYMTKPLARTASGTR
jgi:ribosomal protein S18 acetylase RimI-like enzyme